MYHDNTFDDEMSAAIAKASIKALISKVSINRDYDIPYVAGYSVDGKTIYLDRDLPETMPYKNKEIDYEQFIILHECVEKALIDEDKLLYPHAHHIALMAERAAVEEEGLNWNIYETFMRKYIKEDIKHTSSIPKDLDLTPYIESKDTTLINKMKKVMDEQ